MQVTRAAVTDAAELERAVNAFAQQPNGALIVLPNIVTVLHRDLIIALAARYRLPAVYPYRVFTTAGGFISYGLDLVDTYRRAASYVDLILKGAQPGELPVQLPTKFELVISLKVAKALGRLKNAPMTLVSGADDAGRSGIFDTGDRVFLPAG